MSLTWDDRVAAVWTDDTLDDAARIAAIDALAAERAPDDPRALFERAGARDSAGDETGAEPLYRAALAGGLPDDLRTQAVVQLASTLRNLGRAAQALDMLEAESTRTAGTPMHDAVEAFRALALVSNGRAEEAASVALLALAPHLPRYTRSVSAYAAEIGQQRA